MISLLILRWTALLFFISLSQIPPYAIAFTSNFIGRTYTTRLRLSSLEERSPTTTTIVPSARSNDNILGSFLRGVVSSMGPDPTVRVGSLVVAKVDIPSLGIFVDQSYELRSVYMHGTSLQTGNSIVENIPLETLTLGNRKDGDQIVTGRGGSYPSNYQTIIMLYSPLYHENKYPDGVKVTPEEVGLISFRDEVVDSFLVAIPILAFWCALSFTFASKYNERYGGNFIDAFLGR